MFKNAKFTDVVGYSDELKRKEFAKVKERISEFKKVHGPPQINPSVPAEESIYGCLASKQFTAPVALNVVKKQQTEEVDELSLVERNGCLYTKSKGSTKGELVTNFVLLPIEILEVQHDVDGGFEAESLTFRVRLANDFPFQVSIALDKIEHLDGTIAKKQGKAVVLDRASFNTYVQELRARMAHCLKVKRVSEVEGWVKDKDGKYYHTAFAPNVYITKRNYSAVNNRNLNIFDAVCKGTKFLEVGKYGHAIQAMFLTAHASYMYPFLKESGLRPEFLVILQAPTGSYKTGTSRELYNVFCAWDDRLIGINGSTEKGIVKGITSGFRHETCIIDDVVVGSKTHMDKTSSSVEALTRFLSDQNKIMKSGLVQSVNVTSAPEVICVITAETGKLTNTKSSDMRHFIISFRNGELSLDELTVFTRDQMIMRNYFAAFIRFLHEDQDRILKFLSQNSAGYLDEARRLLPNVHPRITGNLKVLLAINDVVSAFERWASIEESFIVERAIVTRNAIVRYCKGVKEMVSYICTEELLLKLLREGLRNGEIKVVSCQELRDILGDNPNLDMTTVAIPSKSHGKSLLLVDHKNWFEKLTQYATDNSVILDKNLREMLVALRRKGISALGDSGGLISKVPSEINSILNRPRWLAVFQECLIEEVI